MWDLNGRIHALTNACQIPKSMKCFHCSAWQQKPDTLPGFPSATQFQLCLQQYILLSNTLLTQYYKEPWVRWLKHLPDRFKSLMLTCNYANSCDGELKKHVAKVVNLTCLLYVIRKSCHWAEILNRHLFGHLF